MPVGLTGLRSSTGLQFAGWGWQILYFAVALAVVLLLAVAVTRLWAKHSLGVLVGARRHLQLLEQLPLGGNKSLVLVRVLDTVWLLVVTEQNVVVLQEMENSPEFDPDVSAAGKPRWASWLGQWRRPGQCKTTGDAATDNSFRSS